MIVIKKLLRTVFILSIVLLLVVFIVTKINEKKYINETKNINSKDLETIQKVINICKEKIGLEYVWGGKGEIMTNERLNELIGYYGESYYPLDHEEYIGKQAFDCSGLTYFSYKSITNIEIGYSTVQQKDVLKDYIVDIKNLQPGDLIFTPGHVVMYIGYGKVIHSASKAPYPIGGVKESRLFRYKSGVVYRPIDYINGFK